MNTGSQPIFGLLAEYDSPEQLVEAARKTREAGYLQIDALTPYAVKELDDVLRLPRTRIPMLFLIGGIVGCLTGFLMQVYACVYSYPINVGGRPLYSWPAFIPITFELTILFSGLTGAIGMLVLNGFPTPYHPVFNSPRFSLGDSTRFYLLIQSNDSQFDPQRTREFMQTLNPGSISEVPS